MQIVSANQSFRRSVLLFALVFGMASMIILALDPPKCDAANLTFATWLITIIHTTIFLLMLMQFIGLAFCLKKLQFLLFIFYFVLVATMFFVQLILWQSESCFKQSTVLFVWLAIQVVIFYIIVAYGLAVWGSYVCYSAKKRER